ncbi:hypothetical protein FQN53_002089, partial [Emmonsiellopsis sp. PD_33]
MQYDIQKPCALSQAGEIRRFTLLLAFFATSQYLPSGQIIDNVSIREQQPEPPNIFDQNADRIAPLKHSVGLKETLFHQHLSQEQELGNESQAETIMSALSSKIKRFKDSLGPHVIRSVLQDSLPTPTLGDQNG